MPPVRPRSRRTAASRARTAGGDPSYPTTRCRSPVVGMSVLISAPGSVGRMVQGAMWFRGRWSRREEAGAGVAQPVLQGARFRAGQVARRSCHGCRAALADPLEALQVAVRLPGGEAGGEHGFPGPLGGLVLVVHLPREDGG